MTANPVFVNDMRRNFFRRRPVHAVAIMAGMILVLTLGLPIITNLVDMATGRALGLGRSLPLFRLPEIALAVIVPAFTAGSFAKEKEQRTWFEVLMTPLKSGEILIGKFFAALVPTLATLIVLMPPLVMGYIISNMSWGMEPGPWMFAVVLKLLANAVFYVSLVMLSSYFCSNARIALVVSYVTLAIYGGVNYLLWNVFYQYLLFDNPRIKNAYERTVTGDSQVANAFQVSQTQFELSLADKLHLGHSIILSIAIFVFLFFQLQHRKDEKTP